MAMIEKGIFERKQPKRSKNMGLKAGTLFIGLGIGIFFGYLLGEFTVINEVVSFFSMILLFGGAALIFNNFMLAKKTKLRADGHCVYKKVLEGDVDAFRYFVNKYQDMAYSLANSICKSEFLAEEATQEAFVKAFQNLDKFKQKSSFTTWFYKILVNESLRKIKRKG